MVDVGTTRQARDVKLDMRRMRLIAVAVERHGNDPESQSEPAQPSCFWSLP